MTEEPNYAQTYLTTRRGIVAGYMVPMYMGQDATGEPTYIFHKAETRTFSASGSGERDAWAWLAGVAADRGRTLGERQGRDSALWGFTVTAKAVTVSAGVTA
jgi:hypothetical protein